MDSPTLQRRLRGAFDARVFNHGDYNLVYAQPSGTSSPLVIGYRHVPLEMVLCPVDPAAPEEVAPAPSPVVDPDDDAVPAPLEAPMAHVALDNVATVADTGSGYQVETVTGFRTWFEVTGRVTVPVGDATEDGTAVLEQEEDAADFHAFMTSFMDELDRLYAAPGPGGETDGDADLHGAPRG